jgi:hypothetical protein
MVSWFVPQNQADFGLSVAPQNQREGDDVVVHMAPLRKLRRVKAKHGWVVVTGCVGPFYVKIAVFYVLASRVVLVFCLSL